MTDSDSARWEHFEHMADIGVRGFGATPAEAFAQAALALSAVVCDPASIRETEKVEVECEAADLELALADWLNALIYEMAVRGMVFGRFQVDIANDRLKGIAWGEPLDLQRHRPAVEIKGATYTELKVAREAGGLWRAQCVVDV
ncbi:archease [Methylococcus geothermalis]|uniref:Archease n=1 Tax=Methylococcus geothermalis TaxID=2681310 RepID=A0A858Q4A7_9GAMM|nr:archease [Methylococcus geothermalis]QJD28643.1 archease [Methylococcus geothermalis]